MINSLFDISDLSSELLHQIIDLDEEKNVLSNKNIGLLFEKHSTRTRLSFAVGISDLGGNAIDIKFEDLNISREESFEDTFKAMNCYLDGLIYRTTNHEKIIKASKFFSKPIINALSDKSHPCQIISDLFTLKQHFGNLDLKILWIGDMNNVCFSLVEAVNLISNIQLVICSPKKIIKKINWHLNKNIILTDDLSSISFENFNCVMTDVYISMNDEESNDKINLLKPYSVTSKLMSQTNDNCVFMHCLPAKVGLEVSDEVFRGRKSIVWQQAKNRLIAQRKLMQFINWQ